MLDEIRSELGRVGAAEITVENDGDFAANVEQVDDVVKIEFGPAVWRMMPSHLLELLHDLPDGAGPEAVHTAIEQQAPHVWHGEEPEGSRDT